MKCVLEALVFDSLFSCSEHGVGVKADIEEARKWYLRASGQGNKRAVQRLKELKVYAAALNESTRRGAGEISRRGDWRTEGKSTENADCSVM